MRSYLAVACGTALAAACVSLPAHAAEFVVYSPYVVQDQNEVEFRSYDMRDSSSTALDGQWGSVLSVAHSFTSWWRPEIYLLKYQHTPGAGTQSRGWEFENTFQLAPAGEYWADVGFLASYEHNTPAGKNSEFEFGPLFEKRTGRFVHRLNLIWEKQIGVDAARYYEFRGAYSLSYQWRHAFAPGVEVYYLPHDDARQLGPVFYGELASARGNELEYSAGVLFGINRGAPDRTFVLRLEYEFF
jgi:hypothetical protein